MGAIIGYILCNTFWTAQGSLWPTVRLIPWDDLLQCNKLSNALPGKGPCKPNQHSGTEWVAGGTSTPAVLWASHCPRAVQQKAGSLPRRCGKDMARAESHLLAVKQSVSCRKIAKADEICQEGREGGKSFSRRSPQLCSSRHSHSWLWSGEQPLPHLACSGTALFCRHSPHTLPEQKEQVTKILLSKTYPFPPKKNKSLKLAKGTSLTQRAKLC